MLTLQFGLNEGVDKIVFVTKYYQNKHDNKRYRLITNINTKLYVHIFFEQNIVLIWMKVDPRISKSDYTVHISNVLCIQYKSHEILNGLTKHVFERNSKQEVM